MTDEQWAEVLGRGIKMLPAYFMRQGHGAEADDLTGATLARAWEKRHQFRGETIGQAIQWVRSIARTQMLQTVRGRKGKRALSLDAPATDHGMQTLAEAIPCERSARLAEQADARLSVAMLARREPKAMAVAMDGGARRDARCRARAKLRSGAG